MCAWRDNRNCVGLVSMYRSAGVRPYSLRTERGQLHRECLSGKCAFNGHSADFCHSNSCWLFVSMVSCQASEPKGREELTVLPLNAVTIINNGSRYAYVGCLLNKFNK